MQQGPAQINVWMDFDEGWEDVNESRRGMVTSLRPAAEPGTGPLFPR